MNGKQTADSRPLRGDELRQKAEHRLHAEEADPTEISTEAGIRALVHELQVHQVELEMQNEELRRAQAVAAEALGKYGDLFDFAPIGYFLWDRDARILEANLVGAALLGLDRNALVHKRFGQFVASDNRRAFADFCEHVLRVDAKQSCELRVLKNGRAVDVLVEGIATDGQQGQEKLCRVAVIDITAQKRAAELATANRALQAEIAARKQAQAELQHAKEAAETANVAKSRFLANMSHELRTPMNAIVGMTALALGENVTPPVREYLDATRLAADNLLALLNDVLDLSHIEAGGFQLEAAPFDLRHSMAQVDTMLGLRAREKGLQLAYDLDAIPTQLVGDPLRLRQVLVSLVGNAIKFTSQGTVAVQVRSRLVDLQSVVTLEFAVSDTGIGIAAADQQRIFTPFTQVDATTTRHYGGTGLGLSIVRRLVDLMGGRVWVESEVGKGSTFRFTIQVGLQKAPEDEPTKSADSVPIAPSAVPARSLRVLLAEDTPANQMLVTYLLNKRGHALEVAENGQEALEAVRHQRFDVVLMDVQMPIMDGFVATREIRRLTDPEKARLPIIALTAHALKGDAERCLAAGMDGYLSKPVQAEVLLELIERLAATQSGSAARPL